MEFLVSWKKISCNEYEQQLSDSELSVISGYSDMVGEFGEPRIVSIWGNGELQVIKGVRWPNAYGGEDNKPCEHYEWVEDGW